MFDISSLLSLPISFWIITFIVALILGFIFGILFDKSATVFVLLFFVLIVIIQWIGVYDISNLYSEVLHKLGLII
jgi:TctA family transporter